MAETAGPTRYGACRILPSRQQIIDAAKADGFDVSFGADGSMTVKDKDGTVIVQQPDGTWVMKDADGQTAQLGGNWPDNEFTRLVPKPGFKLAGASTSEDEFPPLFSPSMSIRSRRMPNRSRRAGLPLTPRRKTKTFTGRRLHLFGL